MTVNNKAFSKDFCDNEFESGWQLYRAFLSTTGSAPRTGKETSVRDVWYREALDICEYIYFWMSE